MLCCSPTDHSTSHCRMAQSLPPMVTSRVSSARKLSRATSLLWPRYTWRPHVTWHAGARWRHTAPVSSPAATSPVSPASWLRHVAVTWPGPALHVPSVAQLTLTWMVIVSTK